MGPILKYFTTFYQIYGIYYGPPRKLDLIRWTQRYCFTMTVGLFFYSLFPILGILIYGLNALYGRVGSDPLETKKLIESLKPISALNLQANVILYFSTHVHVYWMLFTKGRRLIACLDSRAYRGLDSSSARATFYIITWGVHRLFDAISYSNKSPHILNWLVGFVYSLHSAAHYFMFYAIMLYFMFFTNRCFMRERTAIGSSASLPTIMSHVRCVDREIFNNLDRFNSIISDTLLCYCVHLIVQITFSLSYVVFQKHPGDLFSTNALELLTTQCGLLALICLTANWLTYNFNRFVCRVNRRLNREIRRRRWRAVVKDKRLNGWRVEAFLLSESRYRVQLRIYHVCSLDFGMFLHGAMFAFNTAILLYQTEFW